MKFCLIILIFVSFHIEIYSQENHSMLDVNHLFEFRLDSIEQRIIEDKWGTQIRHYIHFRVKNKSEDTLIYAANSCFYYNHYLLKIEDLSYDINPRGSCSYNSLTPFELLPGESFNRIEWITAFGLDTLGADATNVMLFIPLVKYGQNKYRVDGRDFIENKEQLIFKGKTRIVTK